ncbi:hypothetical protein [Pedobacter frigoris]|uniref:hypothetical protein n=1 Tax=Pedobacter frigoris TaxID=2571272 RepID=UPI00292DC9A5|nr:hypothetical protein [Pedobacter frigoris]
MVCWDKNAANYAGGRREGTKEGIQQGLEQARIEVALEMKQKGVNIESIMMFTKLSREQVDAL